MFSSFSSSNQILESTQNPKLHNAFKHLKSHACKVANFTLQWKDLEDHLRFIHSEIESKLQQNPAAKTVQKDTNPPRKDLILPKNKNPESRTSEIPVKNGKELILYVKEHTQSRRLLQDNLFKLFTSVDEPGKLVLEAIEDFYSLADNEIRRSCVVVLEEFGRVREEEVDDVGEEVREEAKRLALEWKGNLRMDNSFEVLGFLLLLIDFGLVGEFGFDEILKLFDCIPPKKQAPEVFRALGFADKAPEYIQKLISKNRRLEAVRFVYAFELVDQFPPVPLLKGHAKYAKEVAEVIRNKGKNSFKAQRNAANSEIVALRGIKRFIENYNLGSEYPSEMLINQLQIMKKQRKERKSNTKSTGNKAQSQQNNGNKRSAPATRSPYNLRRRIRCKQTVDLDASVNIPPPINSKQPPLHKPITSFVGQGAQNSTPPDEPSQDVPYTYLGTTSNAHTHHSPYQAAHLLSQLSTIAQHSASSFGNYHYASSTPFTSYTSLLARPYELAGSATISPHTSTSHGPYDRIVASNGSSGQFGLAGSATIHPSTSSLPGLNERSVVANDSSRQFGLARRHTPMAGASNASTNTSFPYYGDLPSTYMYYNRQASSSSTGIAPPSTSFNTASYYDRHAFSGGNYGVSSKFPPSNYHI